MFANLFPRQDTYDVVVLGSGAAGLTAAILAHDHGAKVIILEKTDKVGGTSAVSGAGIWVPNNHHMAQVDSADTREEALAYCRALTMGRTPDTLLEAFVDTAPAMLRYLESHTALSFTPMETPDYHPEVDGAKLKGRSVEPAPFDIKLLGEWEKKLRPPSMLAFSMTLQEIYHTYQAFYRPWAVPQDLLAERMKRGLVTLGQALIAGLLNGVLDRGIPIQLSTRAKTLLQRNGKVCGVMADGEDPSRPQEFQAKRGVVLATAGFEWNAQYREAFLPGEIHHPNSPPFNDGDGLRMAIQVGAELANMSEVWNYPSILIPGEAYEGAPLARGIKAERSGPHIIWVNSKGRRFVNEAANYNSVGKAFYQMDTDKPGFMNAPAWAVMDQQFRSRYIVGTAAPDDPTPTWLIEAGSIKELAMKTGIDPKGLEDTVQRWNAGVRLGLDNDFGKGASAFDRYQGDHTASHPNLGAIEQPPFYALPVHAGALGTKGGPRTDARARVLSSDGSVIPGLYAAGNVTASISGPSYFGVGSTLGPAMTWGYLAGLNAARPSS